MKGKEVYSMKKKSLVLSFIMLLCVAFYPTVANAASGTIFGSSVTVSDSMDVSNTTLNGNRVSIANNGTNTVIYLGLQVSSGTITRYNATLKLGNSNFTFRSATRSSGWSGTITQDESDPSIVHVSLTNESGVTTGLHQVATIRLNVNESTSSTETCQIDLEVADAPTNPENPTCEIVDGKYYDDNGVEVTKEEYEEICLNPENPQTGSFLPYAVIIGGIVVAIGLYMFTKKNKIYHI